MARYSSKSWRAYRPGATVNEPPAASPRVAVQTVVAIVSASPCRILGLDPGSQRTGFGIIDCVGNEIRHVTHGCINVVGADMAERLRRIHDAIAEVVGAFRPDETAVERVFVNRNIGSALKLGQARGAALSALPEHMPVAEYAPRAVKLATVGFGAADKAQVAHMVHRLLQLKELISGDPADALGVAICHAQARRVALLTGQVAGTARAR
jgi:crossover junction endodeoxyribonuclease RuvC